MLIIISLFGKVKDMKVLIALLIMMFFLVGTNWAGKHKDSNHSDIWKEVTSYGDTGR